MMKPIQMALPSRALLMVLVGLLVGLSVVVAGVGVHAHAAADATLTVSDCSGETGTGRIGTVIGMAAAGDTIKFSCSGTIPISSTLTISQNLTLDGTGQMVTLDGGSTTRVLLVNNIVVFTLKGITVAHGAGSGGGLFNNGGAVTISNSTFSNNIGAIFGGGIDSVNGFLVISKSTFSNNSALDFGAGLFDQGGNVVITNSTFSSNSGSLTGGAISNSADNVSITNSTFNNNSAVSGGGISNAGTLTITNSTLSNNNATSLSDGGGGLNNLSGSTATINFSTIANNSAPNGTGGGLENHDTLKIKASIVANNTGGNCGGSSLSDQGYNLESAIDCGFTAGIDHQNSDPQLSALANNGGPTQTLALASTSPAIDQVASTQCENTDQRGVARGNSSNEPCDIGAFEFPDAVAPVLTLPTSPIIVDSTSSAGALVNYTVTASDDDGGTITPSCTPTSGSTFPIGNTTVNCMATDSDGNSTMGSFVVDVAEDAPVFDNLPASQTMNVPANSPDDTVIFSLPTAHEPNEVAGAPVDTINVSCTISPGTHLAGNAAGITYSGSCTATDTDGLSTIQHFTLTVVDNSAPTLTLPASPVVVNATSPAGAVVMYSVSAAEAGEAAITPSCTPASGSTFPIGDTTVHCTATDSDPATATGSFVVHVKGAAEQINDLITTVNSFQLSSGGIRTSFDSQLQAVQADLAANNTAQACSDLTSFIAHVNAQSGKHLTTAQANQLLAAASQVQAMLGC